jgi:hypothetical protein
MGAKMRLLRGKHRAAAFATLLLVLLAAAAWWMWPPPFPGPVEPGVWRRVAEPGDPPEWVRDWPIRGEIVRGVRFEVPDPGGRWLAAVEPTADAGGNELTVSSLASETTRYRRNLPDRFFGLEWRGEGDFRRPWLGFSGDGRFFVVSERSFGKHDVLDLETGRWEEFEGELLDPRGQGLVLVDRAARALRPVEPGPGLGAPLALPGFVTRATALDGGRWMALIVEERPSSLEPLLAWIREREPRRALVVLDLERMTIDLAEVIGRGTVTFSPDGRRLVLRRVSPVVLGWICWERTR